MFFYTFLPRILNMSLTASVAIVFVLLLRLLLKKAPKVISYALWSVVLFRLLCPVSIQSGLSLFGLLNTPTADRSEGTSAVEYIPSDIVHREYPEVVLPVPGVGEAISETLPQGEEQLAADPLEAPMTIATYVWLGGVLAMMLYGTAAYLRLRRRLLTASLLRENIYLADGIPSPFVLGLLRPKIYLPSAMEAREQPYIILHEQHHIRRLDHVVKTLAFAALCIHWFNPLVWLAFLLSGKDMEMSCDEAVVRRLGPAIRADYTASLLSLATGKRIIAGMPLAFGEGNTKSRIRNLANWKKPAFWVVLAAVLACVALAVCLLTNPKDDAPQAPEPFGHSYRVAEIVYDAPQYSFTYTPETAPRYQFTSDYGMMAAGDVLDSLESDSWLQIQGAFEEEKLSPQNFDARFQTDGSSAFQPENLRANTKRAWRLDVENDENHVSYYLILTDAGEVYLSYGYDGGEASEDSPSIRWLFRLERTDWITCSAVSDGINAFVVPAYTPQDAIDRGTAVWPRGEVHGSGTLVFTVTHETNVLVVHEEYYNRQDREHVVVEKNSFELERNRDGTFELPVSCRGSREDTIRYQIKFKGEADVYLMEIVFQSPEANGEPEAVLPGTTYVSWQCIYMNPLSSYAAVGGDSGCKYVVGDGFFATYRRNDESLSSVVARPALGTEPGERVKVPQWQWQPFPYTDEEWAALYKPAGLWSLDNISQVYDEILYQPLTAGKFLLRVDGDLWLVELSSNEQMGTYLWSIYSLVPEAAMGVAQWEYAPLLSSRLPVFRFTFDMAYDEISAVCVQSDLVDFRAPGAPSGSSMVVQKGSDLYWSPLDANDVRVNYAEIHFSVHKNDVILCGGTIYLEAGGTSNGWTIYTASVVGTGLHLSPNADGEGGVISLSS